MLLAVISLQTKCQSRCDQTANEQAKISCCIAKTVPQFDVQLDSKQKFCMFALLHFHTQQIDIAVDCTTIVLKSIFDATG